jgi:hypothetical protein
MMSLTLPTSRGFSGRHEIVQICRERIYRACLIETFRFTRRISPSALAGRTLGDEVKARGEVTLENERGGGGSTLLADGNGFVRVLRWFPFRREEIVSAVAERKPESGDGTLVRQYTGRERRLRREK